MAYLKTLIIIIIIFYDHFAASLFDLFKTKSVKRDEELKTILIFFDGKLESMDTLMNKNKEIKTVEQLISKFPTVNYTALKCKYANIVSDVFQLFYEHILYFVQMHSSVKIIRMDLNSLKRTRNWISNIIDRLISFKADIVKMIYDLFKKSNENASLKTSDPSLLKSLLSINLFLYHNVNEKSLIFLKKENKKYVLVLKSTIDAVRFLCKPIIQIINLVDHFRSKNCFFRDSYDNMIDMRKQLNDLKEDSKVSTIVDLLESKVNKLLSSISIKTKGFWGSSYNKNMYDPDNLLLISLIENINEMVGNINVKCNQNTCNLNVAFTIAQNSCNIVDIFKYQNTLFKVIANIFYRKIYFSLKKEKKNTKEIKDLLFYFHEFVSKIMPKNCSSDVRSPMIMIRDSVQSILNNNDKEPRPQQLVILERELEYLIQNSEVHMYESENNLIVSKLCVITLVKSIQSKVEFKVFNQVNKLLSYESNTNDDYSLNYKTEFENESTMELIIPSLDDLLNNLFLFRMLLTVYSSTESSIGNTKDSASSKCFMKSKRKNPSILNITKQTSTKHDDDTLNQSIGHMSSYIINLYKRYFSYPEVTKLLLPLLVHLRYTLSFPDEINKLDLVTLNQISFIVINTIERFKMKRVSEPTYSANMYMSLVSKQNNFILLNGKPNVQKIKDTLKTVAEKSGLLDANTIDKILNDIYDKYVCDLFFKSDLKELQLHWNGSKKIGSEILRDMQQGVIDINDLINYQWYVIKFFVTKFLMKMKYISLHYKYKKEFDHRDTSNKECIKTTLQEFRFLKYPFSVFTFVEYTFSSFMAALDVQNFEKSDWLIDKRLEEIHDVEAVYHNLPAETMDIVCDTLITDINDFKNVLRLIEINEPTSLITEEMYLSNVLLPL